MATVEAHRNPVELTLTKIGGAYKQRPSELQGALDVVRAHLEPAEMRREREEGGKEKALRHSSVSRDHSLRGSLCVPFLMLDRTASL